MRDVSVRAALATRTIYPSMFKTSESPGDYMITLEDAKSLEYREVLVDNFGKRWYVTGAVKTWKRDESRIRIPLKHGLYVYGALTDADFDRDGQCQTMTREGYASN